jgi:hypothetical protein
MKLLKDITLLTVSGSNNIDSFISHYKALKYCLLDFEFKKVKILSPIKPIEIDNNIEYVKIPQLTYNTYSNFMIRNLSDYVHTKYVITIQDDGFIINPNLWSDNFYNYDYIGAPWINSSRYNFVRVGNGGFSFRSKKMLEICKYFCPTKNFNEDHLICVTYRNNFIKFGIKYAPLEVGALFSCEKILDDYKNSYETSFGFHSKKYLKYIIETNKYKSIKV